MAVPREAKARRGARRTPGQRAGLEAGEVVAAARTVAARDGLEGVTMRRLGRELGVAPNALYTYVSDKEGLLDALFDAVLGEIEPPDPDEGAWEETLAELMRCSRALLLAHPHLAPLFLTRPGGANAMRLGEVTLRILERGGVTGTRAVEALRALLAYTLGFAALEAARRAEPERTRRSAHAAARIDELPAASFPLTRAAAGELATHPGEASFEAGLRWLIRGIGAGRED